MNDVFDIQTAVSSTKDMPKVQPTYFNFDTTLDQFADSSIQWDAS